MFERAHLVLRSRAVLRCGADTEVWVTLDRDGAGARVELPRPRAGLGGGEMVVAPDERHAALFVFSGQSQQGYELFALEPELRHLGGVPYRFGTGDAARFTSDSRWIVMLVRTVAMVAGTEMFAEEVLDPDADGELVVDWAELSVQAVPDGVVLRVPLRTAIPASFDPDGFHEWDLYGALELRGDGAVIRLPWGVEVEIRIPPEGPVTAPWSG